MGIRVRGGSAIALALAVGGLLAGCSDPSSAAPDDRVAVVASTDVWGSVVQAVGAGHVAVTSLIDDPARDPHEFQASVRDQLAVSRAAIVVENGGGYDDFMSRLVSAAHARVVLDAVRLSGRDAGAQDFDEHVWFDLPTVRRVADAVNMALIRADLRHRADYDAALARFHGELDRLPGGGVGHPEHGRRTRSRHHGAGPAVPHRRLRAGGPDPPRLQLGGRRRQGRAGRAAAGAAGARPVVPCGAAGGEQRDRGPVTNQVVAAAEASGLPVVGFGETLPSGASFASMFHGELGAVAAAVRR